MSYVTPLVEHETTSGGQSRHLYYTTPSQSISHSHPTNEDQHATTITSTQIHSIDKHVHHDGQSTIFGVYQNMMNAMVGAGILGIPYVYALCGVFGGIVLMLIFALLCTYTMNLLIIAAQRYKVSEYEDLGYASFGIIGYIVSAGALFLMDFGACLSYLIILGDAAFKVLQIWGYHSMLHRQLVIIVVSMALIFPPCLLRDISMYERWSGVKMVGVVLVIVVVIYQFISYRVLMKHADEGYTHPYTPLQQDMHLLNVSGILSAVGIIAYCFVAHDTAFLYYNTLKNPTRTRWSQTVLVSIFSAMALSLMLSIPAYLTFGDRVAGNVLNNFDVAQASIVCTRIVYVIMMAFSFPTAFFVVRHVVYAGFCRLVSLIRVQIYKRDRKRTRHRMHYMNTDIDMHRFVSFEEDIASYSQFMFKSEYNVKSAPLLHHVIFTCVLFAITLVLALYITDLGAAMSIIGNLTSVNLAFIMPCLVCIKCSEYGFTSWYSEKGFQNKVNAWVAIYPPLMLALLGAFVAVYGIYCTAVLT